MSRRYGFARAGPHSKNVLPRPGRPLIAVLSRDKNQGMETSVKMKTSDAVWALALMAVYLLVLYWL